MIDAHIHLWRYSPQTHGWIDAHMQVLRRHFEPQDLEQVCARVGVQGVVAVQAAQTLAENDYLLACAAQCALIRGVVGWVDLRAPNVAAQLEALTQSPLVCGVRHIVQDEPDENFLLGAEFGRGIASLAKHQLVYDLLVYARQLPQALRFVDRFPNQVFVLDHLGKPQLRTNEWEPWMGLLRQLAERPNVYAKLSGLVTEDSRPAWSRERVAQAIDHALDCFGPQRLMVGSDWPVCLLAEPYEGVWAHARSRLAALSPTDRAAVEQDTAVRVYRLDGSRVHAVASRR